MNNDTLQELLSAYHSLQKDSLPEKGEGWVNMANFGPALLKAGIDYKGMGYENSMNLSPNQAYSKYIPTLLAKCL